jgi:hypothetical protein
MKAKVQLLLKKMKNSPNISWNEKGELKYKKHESSRNMFWNADVIENTLGVLHNTSNN